MPNMAGKGSNPRNVGPKFKENFDSINWKEDERPRKLVAAETRTSTKLKIVYIKKLNELDKTN